MTTRHVGSAITAGLLTWGLAAFAPARGRAQEATVLPENAGPITMVGCFLREKVRGHDKWVLASPTIGAATSEREATCSSTGTEQVVRLEDTHKHHLDQTWLGRWIEVSGKLERIEDRHNPREPRELEVKSFRPVPVVAPRAAEVMPAIEMPSLLQVPASPRVEAPAPAEAAPVATTGVTTPSVTTPEVTEQLPHTASPLPLTGLVGFLALASGLVLRRRRIEARG